VKVRDQREEVLEVPSKENLHPFLNLKRGTLEREAPQKSLSKAKRATLFWKNERAISKTMR